MAPTVDLREQLQHTLGTSYVLERELWGGGMSRVFVAEETALRRTIIVSAAGSRRAGHGRSRDGARPTVAELGHAPHGGRRAQLVRDIRGQ